MAETRKGSLPAPETRCSICATRSTRFSTVSFRHPCSRPLVVGSWRRSRCGNSAALCRRSTSRSRIREIHIVAELPGLKQDDIDLNLQDDVLTVSGETRESREEKEKQYHLNERSYGRFERSVRLPDTVDRENISANFENGLLTITLPKTEKLRKSSASRSAASDGLSRPASCLRRGGTIPRMARLRPALRASPLNALPAKNLSALQIRRTASTISANALIVQEANATIRRPDLHLEPRYGSRCEEKRRHQHWPRRRHGRSEHGGLGI